MATVQDAVHRCLARQAHELAGCLLYLDSGAAEAVATGVGLAALQELGVASVCDLGAASPTDLSTAALLSGSPVRRVAFFITTMLGEAQAALLAACSLHAAAAQFTVLCSVSEAAHQDEMPAAYSSSCYAGMAGAWQQHLDEGRRAAGQGLCSVAVLYCPLLLCPLSSNAFVLAAGSAAAALPHVGRLAAGYSTTAEAAAETAGGSDDEHPAAHHGSSAGAAAAAAGTGAPVAAGLHLLAHSLAGISAVLGYRPEAFSLGPCSRLVCRSMAFVPAVAEDAPPAALVLVDRLLDPVSPAQHADLLVQRVYDLLQPSTAVAAGAGAALDAAAETAAHGGSSSGSTRFAPVHVLLQMPSLDPPLTAAGAAAGGGASSSHEAADTPVAPARAAEAADAAAGRGVGSLLPGTLQHPGDTQAERWLEFLLSRKGRDASMFIRKWLREAARKENTPQQQRFKPGSISAAELRCLADSLRRQSPATARRHSALLQLAEAAAAAAEGPHADHWDTLQREERALLFACTESSQAASSHLLELCKLAASPGGSPLRLADLALLVLTAYCLLPDFLPWFAAGDGGCQAFQPQQELQLQEALVEAVMASSTNGTTYGGATSATPAATLAAAGQLPGAIGSCPGPAWLLEQLAARVAAAKQAAAAAAAVPAGSAAALVSSSGGGASEADSGGISSSDGGVGSGESASGSAAAEELQALRLEARDAVEALLGRMRQLSAFRRSQLKQLGRLAAVGQDGSPRHTLLLRQIVEQVLRDQPVPDLHAGATSLSGLLRSGLGRFGLQAAKPKPSDCATVILFVVGGISMAELHDIMQAVDERAAAAQGSAAAGGGGGAATPPPPRIIVGATSLLHPQDVCGHLFADLQAA